MTLVCFRIIFIIYTLWHFIVLYRQCSLKCIWTFIISFSLHVHPTTCDCFSFTWGAFFRISVKKVLPESNLHKFHGLKRTFLLEKLFLGLEFWVIHCLSSTSKKTKKSSAVGLPAAAPGVSEFLYSLGTQVFHCDAS